MGRRVQFNLHRRRAQVVRDGEVFNKDFAFVVMDADVSRWERLRVRLLAKVGRLQPPDRPPS